MPLLKQLDMGTSIRRYAPPMGTAGCVIHRQREKFAVRREDFTPSREQSAGSQGEQTRATRRSAARGQSDGKMREKRQSYVTRDGSQAGGMGCLLFLCLQLGFLRNDERDRELVTS
eukprot:6497716-Pyramimonas_sp.AAC.1